MREPEAPRIVANGWRQTDRPLTVAILGWARLSQQGDQGSGYNLSASELASGLCMAGHRVLGLAAGMRYGPLPGVRIVRRERWRGVECFDLVNSPNVSPAALNFGNLGCEMASPAAARAVVAWLRERGVDIVHIHSLEGQGLDLIGAIEDAGIPVVVTLHNYWFVCPQVDLLRGEREVCLDYEGGRACESCCQRGQAGKKRVRRAVSQAMVRAIGHRATDLLRDSLDDGVAALRGRESELPRFTPLSRSGVPLDAAKGWSSELDDGLLRASLPVDVEGVDRPGPLIGCPVDANERMLSGADRHCAGVGAFAERRRAGVSALARASRVISPSAYLRDVHAAMGVPEAKLEHVPLGQPHFDELSRVVRTMPGFDRAPWEPGSAAPLRLAFHGTTRANKGLEVLVRAVPLLEREVRERVHLSVRVVGHETPFRRRLAAYPRVSFEGQYDLSQLVRLSGSYDVGILSHIWLENSPLVMWEHLHAGKFVVCPRLGGPAGVIRDGVNGRLIEPADPGALASAITRIVRGEQRLPSAREIHEVSPLAGYPEHVERVEGIYRSVLGSS